MKLETIERLKELAGLDEEIEIRTHQRAALKTQLVDLMAKREALLDIVHSDETFAKDLHRRKGRKPKETTPEGSTPTPAKKRGAKVDVAS